MCVQAQEPDFNVLYDLIRPWRKMGGLFKIGGPGLFFPWKRTGETPVPLIRLKMVVAIRWKSVKVRCLIDRLLSFKAW
jgi:hypothetical protein